MTRALVNRHSARMLGLIGVAALPQQLLCNGPHRQHWRTTQTVFYRQSNRKARL
jgi:hypothetical protein